jgi:hypothetical protein
VPDGTLLSDEVATAAVWLMLVMAVVEFVYGPEVEGLAELPWPVKLLEFEGDLEAEATVGTLALALVSELDGDTVVP